MNRRTFFASLIALPAALKALAMVAPVARSKIRGLDPGDEFRVPWFQTKRLTSCVSLEYEDAIDAMFEKDPVKLRANFNARRLPRFRESLRRQLARQSPRLP